MAYPSQEWLARYTGYSVRVIRDETDLLEHVGLLVLRLERQPDGHERIVYMPGQALLAGAVRFLAAYPPRERSSTLPAAKSAGGVPAAAAGELSDLSLQNRSCLSSSLNGAHQPAQKQEQPPERVTETEREVARASLAELRRTRFPDRALVPVFDATEVEMAALCAASVPGDAAAKQQAMTDAITHAFESSKGTPTPRYVWSAPDHFLAHEAHGRQARLARKAARERAVALEAAARARDREWREQARQASELPPELRRMFGLGP